MTMATKSRMTATSITAAEIKADQFAKGLTALHIRVDSLADDAAADRDFEGEVADGLRNAVEQLEKAAAAAALAQYELENAAALLERRRAVRPGV